MTPRAIVCFLMSLVMALLAFGVVTVAPAEATKMLFFISVSLFVAGIIQLD